MNKNFNFSTIVQFLVYLLFFIWLSLFFLPLSPNFAWSGIDQSCRYAIDYITSHAMRFGEDIILTFGPLGSFWYPYCFYNPDTYLISVFVSLLIIVSLFVAFLILLSKLNLYPKTIGLLTIIVGSTVGYTSVWYLFPIAFVGVYLKEYENIWLKKASSTSLLLFLSFSVLVKFSHFPTAFSSVGLIDIYMLYKYKKRFPFFTALFFFFMIMFFVLSGQSLFDFPAYFLGSFQTLTAYSESMQSSGPSKMIYVFLTISAGMLIMLTKTLYKEIKIENTIFLLISLLVLFMAFKNGFVRHDGGHSIQAFGGMAMIFGMLFMFFANTFNKSLIDYTLITIIVFSSIIASIGVEGIYTGRKPYEVIVNSFNSFKNNAHELPNIFSKAAKENLDKHYLSSREEIKQEFPILDINGTVDIYPWDQSYIITNGLDYRPRPIFQSYSVYTLYLIEKNKKFLYSERAPETILFAIKNIDGRLPSMMEGASWLDLMKLYDIVDVKGEFLILKRSTRHKSYTLKPIESKTTSFGVCLEVPSENNVYVEIKIKKSVFGKITDILFKSPILHIELTYTDGHTEKNRIIPGIASSGFILSPNIKDISDFFAFASGNKIDKRVKTIKLINESGCCYDNNIKVIFKKIATEGFVAEVIPNSLKANLFHQRIEKKDQNQIIPY